MSLQVPTIQELYQNLENDLKLKLGLDDTSLKLVVQAMASVLAAQLKLQYLFIMDNRNNFFPDTADLAADGGELERLGNIYINRQPRPSTNGSYSMFVYGEVGSVIRAGLTFKSNDDSKSPDNLYITDYEYILTGANDIIQIRSFDNGIEFALAVGDKLTITEPVVGINQTTEIESIIELPINSESISDYRKAIIDSIQLEPQGGSKTDYIIWAKDAAGVKNVFPYVKQNESGVVQVFIESTKIDSTDGYGTPTQFILNDVEQVIELDPDITKPLSERGRRPIQAILEVLPITLQPVDVEIVNIQQNTPENQTSIRQNLEAYLQTIRPFIAGANLLRDKNDILNSAKLQVVVFDSLNSENYFENFKTYVDGNEVNSYVFDGSNIPYLRNITYTNV